jgi:hypothetical protein
MQSQGGSGRNNNGDLIARNRKLPLQPVTVRFPCSTSNAHAAASTVAIGQLDPCSYALVATDGGGPCETASQPRG